MALTRCLDRFLSAGRAERKRHRVGIGIRQTRGEAQTASAARDGEVSARYLAFYPPSPLPYPSIDQVSPGLIQDTTPCQVRKRRWESPWDHMNKSEHHPVLLYWGED
ncbi:unnamed protein product [Lota lota]